MTTPTSHGAPELLPCPFCGKLFWTATKDPASTAAVIRCVSCGSQGAPKVTKEDARTAWNTRAAIQQAAGAVPEGLVACLRGGAQCDEDGTNIIMNREACCVAADILERLAPLGREAEAVPEWSVEIMQDWVPRRLRLTIGVQSFDLDVQDADDEPGRMEWFRDQLRDAVSKLTGRKEGSSDHLVPCAGGGVTQPLTAESFEAMLMDTSVTPAMVVKRVADALDTDAQRYRHLRGCRGMEHDPLFSVRDEEGNILWGGDLDDAIDQSIMYARDIYGDLPAPRPDAPTSQIKIRTYCEDCGKSVSDERDGVHTCSPQYGKPAPGITEGGGK